MLYLIYFLAIWKGLEIIFKTFIEIKKAVKLYIAINKYKKKYKNKIKVKDF